MKCTHTPQPHCIVACVVGLRYDVDHGRTQSHFRRCRCRRCSPRRNGATMAHVHTQPRAAQRISPVSPETSKKPQRCAPGRKGDLILVQHLWPQTALLIIVTIISPQYHLALPTWPGRCSKSPQYLPAYADATHAFRPTWPGRRPHPRPARPRCRCPPSAPHRSCRRVKASEQRGG